MAAPPSPAHRALLTHYANAFDNDDELPALTKPTLQKQPSKFGRWLSHVHDRLVMRLVCCAPASVVLEVEFEDEDFCRPEDTEIRKIEPPASSSSKLLKKQKSASVVPVLRGGASNRAPSDRDIPTNDELERLPIDLSFVLDDNGTDDSISTPSRFAPVPPATPRPAPLLQRAQQIAAFRQQHSARVIQRRWRQRHPRVMAAAEHTDVEDDDGDKTDLETDTEQGNSSNGNARATKTRRRRIRKHRGRKKKHN